MNLPRKPLGKSSLEITPVGIGTAPIGSNRAWYIYWGETDEKMAIETNKTALDAGINGIDTPILRVGEGLS